MNATAYQSLAARTLLDKPDATYTHEELMLVWNAIGLAGEAGEVCETVKKAVFHRHPLDLAKLEKELGDVLWYLSALCTRAKLSLADVMEKNIAKLQARYPNGYNSADSINRKE